MVNLPEKYCENMKELLQEEYTDYIDSLSEKTYQAIRINTKKISLQQWEKINPFRTSPIPWVENGFYIEDAMENGQNESGQQESPIPSRHPYYYAGLYYIQEPSAMAPAAYLEAQPGERVLDLCAAPGGKSTQIAAAMGGEGLLISNEIHPARAKILSENIERMGIRNGMVINESPQSLAKIFESYFDRIMVDAPCSGEGMFRKNTDACEEWSPENVENCAMRQQEILICAAFMLRPGGRIVYSTCTFAPEENEGTISRFLEEHPEFHMVEVPLYEGMSPARPEWTKHPAKDLQSGIRLFPHKLHGEGHFLAVLEKDGEVSDTYRGYCANGVQKSLNEKDIREYLDFCKENLKKAPQGIYLKFGDQLYIAPEGMPATKGMKVLRPGLHLGTMKKNRFEPSHALALALSADEVVHSMDLPAEDLRVRAYLNGQTFSAEGEKGWYLITVDGYSIGWGKLAGGVMKNHYPKGLRIQY